MQRLDDWSRMNREIHVRFFESLRGQFPWATRLYRAIFKISTGDELLDDFREMLPVDEEEYQPDYPVDLYSQGLEAIAAAQELMGQGQFYSHAFIDMRMPPGIDGLQTAKKLFELDPEIKIIFVTAYSDYTAEDIMAEIGDCFSYVQKPFSEHAILTQVEYVGCEVEEDEWDSF